MIYLFLLILSLFTHWEWTTGTSILTSGDWLYQHPAKLKEYFSVPSIWTPTALGDLNISISFTPFQFLYSILSNLNIDYGLAERIVFFWPILIALPLFSYIFIKNNINNKAAAAIGSFVYSYNTYFALMKTGHLTLLAAYAFMPAVLLLFQKTLEKKEIKYALFTGLFCFIVSFYEFRAFYILCFILFFYFIYFLFFIEKISNFKNFIKLSFFAFVPIFVTFLLNLYWLLALGKAGMLTSNVFFDRGLFGNEFLDILQALTLHHPFWTGSTTAIFEVQAIPLYFWLIPLYAFLGLYFNRKSKFVLFFGFLSLIGIFLTKQVGQPFADVYPWLYDNFPGFNAFREASKFYLLIALGYAVLIAAFVDWLLKNKFDKLIKYGLIILIAFIFVWNTKPQINGDMQTLFEARVMPQDYIITRDFLIKQNEYYRTYWIPTVSRWSFYNNNHPEISAINEINAAWFKFIENETKTDQYKEAQLISILLNKPFNDTLLDLSSVKYVFVPIRDSANDDDFFVYYGKDREYYIQELNKLSYLKQTSIGTKNIVVYENSDYQPHFYLSDKKISLADPNIKDTFRPARYKFITPSEYRVSVDNISKPFYLNFSERYHPQWELRINDFNWFDALTKNNYFISDKNHFQNEAMLNSYSVNPIELCKEFTCLKNKDGSYDIEMTIYFKPQSYVYFGGIISLVTSTVILGYFFYLFIRTKSYGKKK